LVVGMYGCGALLCREVAHRYGLGWPGLLLLGAAYGVYEEGLVDRFLFPTQRAQSWIGPIGMGLCGVAMATVLFVYWEEFYVPPAPVLLAAALLCVLLVLAAFWARGHATAARTSDTPSARVGLIAFVCTAVHFVSVYSIPSTGLPWPIGVALTLVPVAIGVLLVRRKATGGLDGPDALRVVTGIVTFFLLPKCSSALAVATT
jgi:hypothetical protein